MRADRKKIELAMARMCMNPGDLVKAAKMPAPTVKNVICGRGARPATIGRVAVALNVDVAEILAVEGS